jgi:hypothetical protein
VPFTGRRRSDVEATLLGVKLVVAALCLAACARVTPPGPAPTSAGGGGASAAAAGQRDGGAAPPTVDAATEAFDEDQEVRTIALKDAPLVTIRLLGAALIEVTLAERAQVEVKRRASSPGAVEQRDAFGNEDRLENRRLLHTARPGATYRYRARSSGSDWSDPVTLRAPAPTAPPRAPSGLTARAETPFAVRLAWEASVRATAGFEILTEHRGQFVRAALVDPTERDFVHHLRVPGRHYRYRVRAFNSAGASEPTPEATITMPAPAQAPKAKLPAMGPCVQPVVQAPQSSGCNPEIEELYAENGRVVFSVPGAGNGCERHLMGDYAGCRRRLGVFTVQADITAVPDWSDEGWPLLHAIAGAGQYVGASIETLRFTRGRYLVVDVAQYCGDGPSDRNELIHGVVDGDPARSFPPFEQCQLDTFAF